MQTLPLSLGHIVLCDTAALRWRSHTLNYKFALSTIVHTASHPPKLPSPRYEYTCRFNLDEASVGAGWQQELLGTPHTPESLQYGITNFTYKASKPFHPMRLWQQVLEGNQLPSVMRSKGFFWLASHPASLWEWSTAGARGFCTPVAPIATQQILLNHNEVPEHMSIDKRLHFLSSHCCSN